VLSHFKQDAIGGASAETADPLAEHDLYRHVIYRCVVGSRAYGLDGPESDTDRRGVYLPPAERHWSLYGVPEQLENPATEEVYWEFQKFLTFALKANPNVVECLYTPLVEHATPLAEELRAMRGQFLSKLVYQTYNGYVTSQFKKLQADLRNKGAVKWKHVMHLLRLLLAGITALREGVVPVHVGPYRDRLLSVKRGEVPFEEIERWRIELHKQFDAAFETTALPDRPDYAAANALLLRARRSAVTQGQMQH
jgi:predicted nucleotidyltransferase